jgi:hypothetical protein
MPPNNKRSAIDIERERFAQKYGATPNGKTAVGMVGGSPVYSDKTSAIDIERERFAQKYGSAPAGKDLVGMKSGNPVYGDASQTAGYKTPSAEEISSTFQELEDTKGYSPKPEGDLDKRKELASVLKQFARNEVKVNPEDMVKAGATMGVSRGQLSNLYQQYRKDFQNNPPQDLMSDTPPTGTTPTGTTPTGTTPTQPSLFSGEYQKEGPVKGPSITSTTPAATPTQAPPAGTQDSGPATPRLDRLAAMQGTPIGSTSTLGQRRSLESESGKALRMARRLERQGFGRAAEQVALAGAQAGLAEPAFRTQAFREKQSQMSAAAAEQSQAELEEKRKNLEFLKRAREQGAREMEKGGISPATAALFGNLYKQ